MIGIVRDPRGWMRAGLIILYSGIGVLHLTSPERFLPIVPDFVPFPILVILATGVCELAGILGLLIPRTRKAAGLLLALYAICVFPANIKHALEGIHVDGLPDSWWYHGPRLVFQPILVWWALYATHLMDWPWTAVENAQDHPSGR